MSTINSCSEKIGKWLSKTVSVALQMSALWLYQNRSARRTFSKECSDLFRDSYLTKHVKLFRFWWGSTTATAELYSGKYSNYFKSTGKPQNDLKMNRSIRPNVFYKKSFPRNFAKFTWQNLLWSPFLVRYSVGQFWTIATVKLQS